MKRISPEQVLEAYVSNDLVPIQNDYVVVANDKNCACGLSAYLIAQGQAFEQLRDCLVVENVVEEALIAKGYGRSYQHGFIRGFDDQGNRERSEAETQGYIDGTATWRAVRHLAEK